MSCKCLSTTEGVEDRVDYDTGRGEGELEVGGRECCVLPESLTSHTGSCCRLRRPCLAGLVRSLPPGLSRTAMHYGQAHPRESEGRRERERRVRRVGERGREELGG